MEQVFLETSDGYKLDIHVFEVENPIGYVQVIHGMEEHQERYEGLAKALNESGFTVVTSNMRGHGESAPLLGYFSDKEGYKLLIEDQKRISKFIIERFKTDRINIFAHSMGTIITRNLLLTESKKYQKVVLSGYPQPNGAAGAGIFLAKTVMFFRGAKYYSNFLENLAVGSFNKAVKNPRTASDWLSYNTENVDKYIEDPYCGHGFKVSALRDLFTLMKNMMKAKNYTDVYKDLPLFLISGEDDPCTGGEKGREKSIKILSDAGFKDISVTTYPMMRHEILNEKENETVIKDTIEFLKK